MIIVNLFEIQLLTALKGHDNSAPVRINLAGQAGQRPVKQDRLLFQSPERAIYIYASQ
jgi:hypothetical protein